MTLGEIYSFFIREGMAADPGGRKRVDKKLRDAKKEFRGLPKKAQKLFDKERLKNPYADTRILHGDRKSKIRSVLVGIDVETPELLLAENLRREGRSVDLVLAHHPEGLALAGLFDVMDLQVDLLCKQGLRPEVARKLMQKRIDYVRRRLHSGNHSRAVDVARLLDIPYMCCHTPTDNLVAGYLQKMMDKKKPKRLKDILDLLIREPEYRYAAGLGSGPEILVGGPKDKAGRVFVDMTGGTEGSKEVFARLSQAGIDTILCMHLSEDHYQKVSQEYIRVVNAGHIASDNLGINLMLDKLQRRSRLDIIECSGFRRCARTGR